MFDSIFLWIFPMGKCKTNSGKHWEEVFVPQLKGWVAIRVCRKEVSALWILWPHSPEAQNFGTAGFEHSLSRIYQGLLPASADAAGLGGEQKAEWVNVCGEAQWSEPSLDGQEGIFPPVLPTGKSKKWGKSLLVFCSALSSGLLYFPFLRDYIHVSVRYCFLLELGTFPKALLSAQ